MSRARWRRWALPLIAGVSVGLVGCRGGQERASKERDENGVSHALRTEGARLSRAIDQLRAADNDRKAALLERLAAEPCEELCSLKEVCGGAYREHVAALDAIRTARSLTAELSAEPGDEEQARVAAQLEEAQRRLETARERSGECLDEQGAVKLRLRL